MRKIVVSEFVSLDGVADSPDRLPVDWDDDAMDAHGAAVLETQDAVILGRHTYDEWVQFWPQSTIEPFATFINGVSKFVASSRSLEPEWANSSIVEGDLIEFVTALKGRAGGDIGVYGSISVAQALLCAGSVDELRLVILPAVAGTGGRLLADLPALRLETIAGTTSPKGKVLVDYRVTV